MNEEREELRDIARGVRRQLEQLSRMGVYAGAVSGQAARAFPALTADAATAAVTDAASVADAAAVTDAAAVMGADADAAAVTGAAAVPAAAAAAAAGTSTSGASAAHRLRVIREDLGDCTRCKLHATRTKIAFGVGSATAPLMFVGEAPGAEEDRRGEPFVGAAGQLLDRMIAAMGWTRETVYIANILKCRPPGNRDPQPDEIAECLPFLRRQIEAVRPRVIVALGRPAAQTLLGTTAPISALRGRFHELAGVGVRVMPTFHPAFLLRQPERKRDAWSDLKQVIQELDRLGIRSPHPSRS